MKLIMMFLSTFAFISLALAQDQQALVGAYSLKGGDVRYCPPTVGIQEVDSVSFKLLKVEAGSLHVNIPNETKFLYRNGQENKGFGKVTADLYLPDSTRFIINRVVKYEASHAPDITRYSSNDSSMFITAMNAAKDVLDIFWICKSNPVVPYFIKQLECSYLRQK